LFSFFALQSIQAQTAQFLDAKVVKSNLQLQWNPVTNTLQWDADGSGTFRNFPADTLFLTKSSIYVTYPALNPLKLQATASSVAVDDPAYGVVTQLITALTSLTTTLSPDASAAKTALTSALAAAPVPPCSTSSEILTLSLALTPDATTPTSVKTDIATWTESIDAVYRDSQKSGPLAIAAGVSSLNDTITVFTTALANANNAISVVKNCAAHPDASAPDSLKAIYVTTSLIDFSGRIQRLTNLKLTAQKLKDTLTNDYAAPSRWNGKYNRNFIVSNEIVPTYAKMQTVTVKTAKITINTDDSTGLISADQAVNGTTAFNVRKYSVLAPEIGVGAVFGFIERPIYGTGTNSAGQTIVTKQSVSRVNVAPTILANFVCRCSTGLISPMFQIGVATSKDLPSILLGGGLRLFGLGKGDVAIGGGAMFGWYKDLQKLQVGSIITGTTDINNDLAYISTPKVAGYMAIQYKF
jgi:hypothetical protein